MNKILSVLLIINLLLVGCSRKSNSLPVQSGTDSTTTTVSDVPETPVPTYEPDPTPTVTPTVTPKPTSTPVTCTVGNCPVKPNGVKQEDWDRIQREIGQISLGYLSQCFQDVKKQMNKTCDEQKSLGKELASAVNPAILTAFSAARSGIVKCFRNTVNYQYNQVEKQNKQNAKLIEQQRKFAQQLDAQLLKFLMNALK